MSEEQSPEIQANLDRAHEPVAAAEKLFEAGHYDFAASRAYYAAFERFVEALGKLS